MNQALPNLDDGVHVDTLSADGDAGEGRVLHWLVCVLNIDIWKILSFLNSVTFLEACDERPLLPLVVHAHGEISSTKQSNCDQHKPREKKSFTWLFVFLSPDESLNSSRCRKDIADSMHRGAGRILFCYSQE